ncbi:MAG: hypothetical protein UT03_C0051G0001, partial [Candidatus Moranbacteria bacterium GW2011_GWD2_38_7]
DAMMAGQSSFSLGTAQWLAGHENVFRVNPVVSNGKYKIDLVKEISSLKGMGDFEARKALPSIRHFFDTKSEPFEPSHKL